MEGSLTGKELEILKNISTESAKKLSKVFSTLLGKNARMHFKEADVYPTDRVSSRFEGEYLCLKYNINDINKTGLYVVAKETALALSSVLLNKSQNSSAHELSPKDVEVCSQAFRKILEAESAIFAQMINKRFTFQLQDSKTEAPFKVLKEASAGVDEWIVCEYRLGIEGFSEGAVYGVYPKAFGQAVLEAAAGKISSKGEKINGWNPDSLKKGKTGGSMGDISLLLDTPLSLTVELGRAKMNLKDIMQLGIGSIVELDRMAGETVDIKVNNKLLAKGEVVVIDENFGIRIVSIAKPNERV
ncbi:MAG: flagellar motor switch protein FliN [Candidatus Omnitrophica bacterium]|nr:flagellar motor switch protein FliN [Candidatus Omnitrophota bacterium]MBD3269144.1 flagellar motor switch protein FliN [Candidatus Omnitrophota bacterium]